MKAILLTLFTLLISILTIKSQEIGSLSEKIINSTIRIECWHDTIVNGIKIRNSSLGTGFFFAFTSGNFVFPVIVTNAHVLKNMDLGILNFTEEVHHEPKYGSILKDTISDFKNKWILHPTVDLAILPILPIVQDLSDRTKKKPYCYYLLSERLLPNDTLLKEISAIEEVFMIGYPKGIWDEINNIPVVRKGTTATPFFIDYQGKKEFLLDISIFPGSSGSPIILYDPGSIAQKGGEFGIRNRISLLGITVKMIPYKAIGELKQKNDSIIQTTTNLPMNLAIIIKSSELLEFKQIIQKKYNFPIK
jgi:hypothetical protein